MRAIITLTVATLGLIPACSHPPGQGPVGTSSHPLVTVDGTGTGCTAQGWDWIPATNTCRMTADLVNTVPSEPGSPGLVTFSVPGITLDCDNRWICSVVGPTCDSDMSTATRFAVWVTQNNTTIKNCRFKGGGAAAINVGPEELGVPGQNVLNLRVQNTMVVGGSYYVNPPPDNTTRVRMPDRAIRFAGVNGAIVEDFDFSGTGDAAIENKEGDLLNTVIRRGFIHDTLDWGLWLSANNPPWVYTQNGGVIEDVDYEGAVGRVNGAVIAQNFHNGVIRRVQAWAKPNHPGAGVKTGFNLSGVGSVLEDSLVLAPTEIGIRASGGTMNGVPAPLSWTIRDNVVLGGAGALRLPSSGSFLVEDNVLCASPALLGTPGVLGILGSDVTRPGPTTGGPPPGTSTGSGNTCESSYDCTWSGSSYTCQPYPTAPGWRDADAPFGQPCRRRCD